MPYIKKTDRDKVDPVINLLIRCIPKNNDWPGMLNYVLTRIGLGLLPKLNYNNLSQLIGVLETMKLEVQRRLVDGYEEVKINENGDVVEYFELEQEIMDAHQSKRIE